VLGLWVLRSLRTYLWAVERQIGRTVSGLLAGIVFVDWLAVADARDFVRKERRVPARVFIGPDAVGPAEFLVGMARSWSAPGKGGAIALGKNVEVLTARRIAKDTPGLFGGWIIHKEGFRAPKVMEV